MSLLSKHKKGWMYFLEEHSYFNATSILQNVKIIFYIHNFNEIYGLKFLFCSRNIPYQKTFYLLICRSQTQEETILFLPFLPKLEPVNMFPEQSLSIWNLQLLVRSFIKFTYMYLLRFSMH